MATLVEPRLGAAHEANRSAVSWAPIFAGAVAAIAATLILIALGSGLGFAAASPWPGAAPSIATFAVGAGIWLIITQWFSAFLGGYITGRLRTKWTGVHTHEVLFRDTAHGLLSWAVATATVGAVALALTSATVGIASSAGTDAVSYATDTMLRSSHPANGAVRDELVRVLGRDGAVQATDRDYVVNVVAAQSGIPREEAEKRVDSAITSIRDAADKARKTSSAVGFVTALSMLIGAFIASVAAAYGGRLRDEHADLS